MTGIVEIVCAFLFVVLISLVCLHAHQRNQPEYVATTKIPGNRVYPVVGSLLDVLPIISSEAAFKHATVMAKQYKQAYRFYMFGVVHYWPIRAIEIDFLMNSSKHIEKSFFYKFLDPMMGDGLLCSTSKKWLHRRKILTPAFHFNILQQFLAIFKEESIKFVDDLKDEKHKHGTELHEIISRFTLNNICETAMGVKLNSTTEPDNYRESIYRSGELLFQRYINPIYYNDTIFSMTRLNRTLHKCVKGLHDFSSSVIKQRRQAYLAKATATSVDCNLPKENVYEKARYAMLDTLLEAEANGGQIDEAGIHEEVDTFMFEGYDTTSAGILFCLLMIATHQDVQQQVFEELSHIIELHDGDTSDLAIQDYNEMKLLDRVIKESLRLYPPVPYIARQLQEPADLGSVVLPSGTQVHIFIYNLHRDPEQFPEPDRFDADRFLPENAEKRHPFAYIPFSAGPRNCIGQKFAMLEMKALIVTLLHQYRLKAITKVEDVVLVSDLVLRTKDPVKIQFEKRIK